jgi:hypothetical protein
LLSQGHAPRYTADGQSTYIELSEMDPKVQAIGSNWEAEIEFPNNLKPPDLLKMSYRLKYSSFSIINIINFIKDYLIAQLTTHQYPISSLKYYKVKFKVKGAVQYNMQTKMAYPFNVRYNLCTSIEH